MPDTTRRTLTRLGVAATTDGQDLKPEQLVIGYNGIKYDAKGQNTLAATFACAVGEQEIRLRLAGQVGGAAPCPAVQGMGLIT